MPTPTQDEVVARIKKVGWNCIRWGKPPMSLRVIDALLEDHGKPEYFLIGRAAFDELQRFAISQIDWPTGDANQIGGVPIHVRDDIPLEIFAAIHPDRVLFPGESYEMPMHFASWIKTEEQP